MASKQEPMFPRGFYSVLKSECPPPEELKQLAQWLREVPALITNPLMIRQQIEVAKVLERCGDPHSKSYKRKRVSTGWH